MTTTKKAQPEYLTQQDAQPNWDAFDAFVAPLPPEKVEQHAGILRTAGDMAIKGAQGVVGLGQAAVGLGSLATGGLVGEGMRAVGYDPKRTNEFLGDYLSDDQKASDAAVQNEDSFLGAAAATVTHPRALAGSIVESLPGMIAGMGASSAAARAIGTKAAAAFGGMGTEAGAKAAAAAIEQAGGKLLAVGSATEGAQSAGQIADDAQAAGRTYGQYAPAAVAAGLGTAAIGLGAGKLMGDAATDIATGARTLTGSKAAKVGKEFLSEGVLEEMPQSAQEQYFTNIAQGESDLGKGVANAAGMGLVTGGVMGAGMGMLHGDHGAPVPAPVPLPDTGPLSRAANAVQAATAAQSAAAPAAPAASTTAPADLPPLADVDARMAELVAIGHGTLGQRTTDAAGNRVDIPAAPGRRLTPDEMAEFNSLKQARAARVAIPADQQAEYNAMLAEEQAQQDQKFEPAKQAAAQNRDDAERAQIAAMLAADEKLRQQTEQLRQQRLIEETNARVERERVGRSEANRAALRDDVLADESIPADDKKDAFRAALKREGYRSPVLTEADHQEIDTAIAPVPSAPNELVDAVPERKNPAPAASVPNTQAVDAAIAAGMRLKSAKGNVLHKAGSTKIFRLSTAQRAYYDQAIARQVGGEAAPAAQTEAELAAPATPLDQAAHAAATSPLNDLAQPTQAQKEAGNYKVGRVRLHGMDLSIENPAGSTRSGVDKTGKPWETTMNHHYGYIRGTVGADKDHIDTFIGPNHHSDKVFVVDQIHPDSGKFDEHKVMMGFDSLEEARQAYQSNYDASWTGGRTVTETTVEGFKAWLDSGKTKKPFTKPGPHATDSVADVEARAKLLGQTDEQAKSLAAGERTWRAQFPGRYGQTPEQREQAPASAAPAESADPVILHPAASAAPKLTKIDLNKMTVKDMTDDQLLQAREVFADHPARGPKVEKEIEKRGLRSAAETRRIVADELVVPEKAEPDEREHARILAELYANAGNPIDTDGRFKPGVYGTSEQPLKFVSGMTAPGDFTKLFSHGKNVGISMLELSKVSVPRIAEQLAKARGAYLFVDSGAFSIHMSNVREKQAAERELREAAAAEKLDHAALFGRYEDPSYAISVASDGMANGRAFFVMPDIVGDQAGSLALVKKYADEINGYGSNAIVPLQGGELTLTQAYEQMMRHLGMDPDDGISPIIGIPSQAEAVSNDEFTDLLRKYGDSIHGVHILGAVSNQRLQPRLDAMIAAGYDTNVSADANRVRSLTSKTRPRKQAVKHILDSDMADGEPIPRVVRDDQRPESFEPLSELAQRARKAETVEPTEPGVLANATAPEHVVLGVDDRELGQIVEEFNSAQAEMMQGDHPVSNIFQPPGKREVVRLEDKARATGKLWDKNEVKAYQKNLEARELLEKADEPVPAELAKAIADFEAVYLPHVARLEEEAKAEIGKWKNHAQAQGDDPATRRANGRKIVLSLFDLSGEWSRPWEEAGYQVYRFDIQDDPTVGDVNNFSSEFFGDWFGDFDGLDIHAILAATPCTDFAVSGARHFAAKDKDGRTISSVKLVHQTLRVIEYFKPSVWAVENPVGRIEKLGGLPPWRLSFDPNHLGDSYTKKTLLWGRFNADLPIAPVEPTEGSKMHRLYGGKSMATKNARSETPKGFSYGFFMANNAADHPAMALANKFDRLDRALIEQAMAAGVTEEQITEAVEDHYYMDLDDDAANAAVRDLIVDATAPDPEQPAPTKPKARQERDKKKGAKTAEQERQAEQLEQRRAAARAHWKVGMVTGLPSFAQIEGEGQRYTMSLPGVIEAIDGDKASVRIYAAPEYGYTLEDYPLHRKLAIDVPLTELGKHHGNTTLERIASEGKLAAGDPDVAVQVRATKSEATPQKRDRKATSETKPAPTPAGPLDPLAAGLPDDVQTYTTKEANAEWDGARVAKRGMLLGRVGQRGNEALIAKSWDDMTPAERQVAHAGMNGDFYGPGWYTNKQGKEITRANAPARSAPNPEQLAEESAAQRWGDMGPSDRFSLLLHHGIGKDAEHGKFTQWHQLAPDLRASIKREFGTPASVVDNRDTNPGEYIVRTGNGRTNLARFEIGRNAKPVRIKYFHEASATRSEADNAIAAFMADRKTTSDAVWAEPEPAAAPAVEPKAEAPAADKFAGNKLFTSDAVEKARARMKAKLGNLNSGIDPELMMDGITIAGAYIEAGVRSFTAFSKAMIGDLGEGVRPYLRSFYEGVRHYPGLDTAGMSTVAEIDAMEQDATAPHTQPSTEKNDAIGETVKATPKAKKQTDTVLRDDWGVSHIDGWAPIAGGKNENSDYGLRGGLKDAFLKDAQNYLRKVSADLQGQGFVPYPGPKGKPGKIVSINESGVAGSGDVTLYAYHPEKQKGIYLHIGDTAIRGMVPSTKSGIALMMRVGTEADRSGAKDRNRWMPVNLSAVDLAEQAAKAVHAAALAGNRVAQNPTINDTETIPAPAETKEQDNDSTPAAVAPAIDSPVADGHRPAGSDAVTRGAEQPRAGTGRDDARSVREPGGRDQVADDAREDLGDRPGHDAISDRAPDAVGGNNQRVSADYRPDLGGLTREGSWLDTAKRNVDLIELALKIESENRPATAAEQAQLAKYVGFGASAIRNKLFPIPPSYSKQQDPNRLIWPSLISEASWRALAERMEALPAAWQRSVLQSSQYAHYTSEGIIRSTWGAMQRLGFTGGKVFEPGMGIGSFSMLMPDAVRKTSRYTGIEFDGPTALIARLLSPEQNMLHDDFIKRKFPKDFFDVAIGNPPFSQTQIFADPDYEKHGFMLHDFFFAKSIDRVRPGGLLAFVTSKGTMDKQTDKARKYLAARADLVGAVRLPSTAFEDNAGTSVVTDVIFLRKRVEDEAPAGEAWANVATVDTKDGPTVINEYFANHPEMVLGQNRISGNSDDMGRRINSNGRGAAQYTVVSYDQTPAELDAKFAAAVERLPQNVYSVLGQSTESVQRETAKVDFDPSVKREGVVYQAKDGSIMRVENGVGVPLAGGMNMTESDKAWFASYIGLRDLVNEARLAQATDGKWESALKKLNKAYDAFRKQHGPINDFRVQVRKSTDEEGKPVETESRIFKNRRRFREDYDSAILTQLETINEAGEIVKSAFLQGRTIGKPTTRDIKTVGDALAVSLDETGRLNLEDVGRRIGLNRAETIEALGNQVYQAPAGDWQLADEYLSGDVVSKLEEAEQAARLDESLYRNVEALKAVQPEKLGPSQISAKLGASWIPAAHVNAFAAEIGAGAVTFDAKTETWQVDGGNLRNQRRAGAEYGTAARSPSELLESALNSRSVKILYGKGAGELAGKVDQEATTAANEMLKKIKDKFKGWVWTDSERATELVESYNRRYNNIAPRRFDGSYLTLPGVSMRYNLHPHQKRAIARVIQTGDTYLAHAVGSGKTIEMIAAGMEQKRLGLIKKPMYVVPNHMLEQFSNEFMELYPLANIMVADDENFSAERRKAFIANATMNNPDAVIITHDAFQRIGVKEESVAPIRDEILADLEIELSETAKDNGARVRRSQLEQQIEAVTQRFDRIISAGGKDSTLKFEDIGVDFIFADEAHVFRKLDFHTSQQIKGIDPNGSKRALDMYVKTRWLEQQRPGRAMVFASGTPVTNTMGELYTIMRFFAPDEMNRAGIATFDAWARQFGEVAPALEPNAAGKYELIERFAKFDNVPELMSRVRQFMDVLTSEHLGALVKRPDLIGGKPNLNIVQSGEALQHYMKTVLGPRIERSKKWKPSRDEPNNPDPIVSIITDGRFAAIDPRFFGGELGEEGSIITEMGDKVVAAYHAGKDNVYQDENGKDEPIKGSTQIVFYNMGFGEQSQKNRGFNARAAFTKRLTDGGIPRDQIAWFDDANTDAKKGALAKAVRSGKVRVQVGSAKKMGTGGNWQKRLQVLHYQDPPWFPADVEQPHGRIIRQGNQNAEVGIEWYTTKGTYQSTMWQMVGRKQRFIDQAFSGDKTLRSMDDMGEASLFEQAAAVASGDPRAIQLAGLKQDVERFERLQAAHASEQINVRSALRSAEWQVESAKKRIVSYGAAFKVIGERFYSFTTGKVGSRLLDKVGEFGQAVKDAFNQVAADATLGGTVQDKQIATLGDNLPITVDSEFDKSGKKPSGELSLYVNVGDHPMLIATAPGFGADVDAVGLGRRMVNSVNSISTDLSRAKSELASGETDVVRLRKKMGAPFEYQQEMAEKYGELKRLEEELRLEGLGKDEQAPALPIVINEDGSIGEDGPATVDQGGQAEPDPAGSGDAEYFRGNANDFLPALPAGVDTGAAAPVELTGRDLLEAKKSTEQLNRQLVKAGMEPVRALRVAPNANFALARQIGEKLGIKVNFVSKNPDFEGVAYNGIAYLADGMRNAELAIAGHETLHALEQGNPALGAQLRAQIRAYLKDGVVEDRQAREYAANGLQDVSIEQAEAEVIADINGAMWMDPVFWADLARADRSLFRSVAYKFMELATKAIKNLRGSRFDVAALVRDVEAVRAIMVSTWAEHNAQRDARAPVPVVARSPAVTSVPALASVPSVAAEWLSDQAIAEEVDHRIGQFAHQPAVRIRDTAFGVLPGVARDDRISGAVFDGAIYLFRDALPTRADVQKALFHELLHYGIRRFIPKGQYITHMKALYLRDGAFRAEADRWIATRQGQQVAAEGGMDYAIARGVDEALAVLAEPNAGAFLKDSLRAKAERAVQRWLGRLAEWLGMKETAAYWRGMKNEEARALIRQMFRKVETDAPPTDPWLSGADPTFRGAGGRAAGNPGAGPDGGPRREAFKRWFGNSKVVDENGKPLVVYHGTGQDFDSFKGATYLTAEPGQAADYAANSAEATGGAARVIPAYVSLKNPAIVDGDYIEWAGYEKAEIDRLIASGHDGMMNDSMTEILAFRPEQIKSATGNNGNFDPANPDIAFSRVGLGEALASAANNAAELRLPAGYRVGDLFNQSGKISWWHKTLGTMDNLAKRQPAFAKVYEAVQSFIGDVSRYAVVAADLAPTLLPKLENIADIIGKNRKKPLTAADTKAIGAPIFEGTLAWARDAHGKPVKIAELEAQAEQMTTAQKAQILLQKGIIDDGQNRSWLNNPLDFYDKIINSKFAETQLKAGVVWSDAELRSMFNLTDGQVALYHEFRAAIDKSLTNLTISEMVKLGGKDAKGMIEQAVAAPDLTAAANLLRDHFVELARMHPEQADMHLDTAKQIVNLGDKGKDLIDRGYAPLSRFGKHTVYVQQDGEQVYFGMFETQYEAAKMARDMRAEHPDAEVSHGTISEDAYKLFAGVSPETIELFGSMVGLDSQADAKSTEVYQTYLKLAKNNRSSMKRLIHRKGIAGFSEDAGRVLAGFVYSNARLTAGNAHLGEIDEAVTEIPKQQGELTDAAMQLREHIRNPEGGGSKLGGLMFAQFLGGSVASAMVNLTQPFTMTLPFLSQWGGIGKAGKRLASAIRDAGKETTGDAQLDAALQWASDEGIVAPQEVHFLQAQAQGKGSLRTGDGTRAGNARAHLNNTMSKVSLGWGKLFAMAELTNRRVTFIAAYRTAVEEGQPNPERFAQEAVSQTQGTYNSGNKPKWARGAIGGLLLTFKQYSVGYLELLSRMAFAGEPGSKERAAGRRAALYMVAVLFLMGGADGLPFEQDLEDALDGILQRLGYNFSTKRKKQAFLTDVLGQGGADFALKGISSMPGMPVDVAGRFGMGNLIPGTGLLTKKQSYTSDLGELAGPAGDLAKRAFAGAGKALGGDLLGAALDLSPASVRNVAKGLDMLDTGTYRDGRGYIVNHTEPSEAVMKMIGFQPNSTSDIQDQKGQALNMISQNRMRSSEIAEHWAQGLANGNPDMVQEAREWRADWNEKNPEAPIKVDMPAIIRRVRAMRQDAIARTQKTAPAALKQTVRAELAATRG